MNFSHHKSDINRDAWLDLFRAVAILMVLAYHIVQMSPIRLPDVAKFTYAGQFGVDLFFVLSGWLIGGLYWRERARFGNVELLRFWSRRWLRTIPPYLAALALSWLAVWHERHEPFNWGYLFFIQNYYDQIPFFLVSWSLCIEEHFYLFLPLLLLPALGARLPLTLFFVALILVAPICRCWYSNDPGINDFGFYWTATHLRFEGLLLGFWAAYVPSFAPKIWASAQSRSIYLLVIALILLIATLFLSSLWMYRLGLSVLALGLIALLLALAGKEAGPMVSSPVIRWISLTSYSVYLTHALMIHVSLKALQAFPNLPWALYFPFTLALIFAGGAAFFFGIERTSILLRDAWVRRRG